MRSIKRLPEAIHSSIRSGIVLYDLARVVEELVYNSLDAGANKVSVAVGVGTCYIKVADNGSGVSRDGLELLGERYATSKYDPLDDTDTVPLSFGYRGEALSSITDVSLVEILTKAHGRPSGYRKVLKDHKCLYLGINDNRQDVGTTVRDLFYNQPVRRKHILSNPKKVMHTVKECVLRIALVHPYVFFKVVDIESEDELLHTCPFPSQLPLLAKVFGIEASSSLEELNAAGGGFKLSGYISGTHDISSWKAFQYVYINSRFICKGPIHKMLNKLAASFNICSQNEKRSGSQICPSFILNLNCPKSCYDLTFEPSKTSVEFKDWDFVLTFIGDAVGRLWGCGKSADLHVKPEIGKKRCRVLNSLGSRGTPSPQSKKLTEECNNFHASRENLSPSEKFHANVSVKLNTDCRFVCQTDPDQASDGSPFHCRSLISRGCSSDLSPLAHNVFSPEGNFLDNDIFGLSRSNKRVNYIFSSGWESVSPKIDDDDSDVNEDVGKPFLQSCFLHRRLKPSLATDEIFEFKFDDHSKQNAFIADDRVVEEVNDINKILSPRNAWHNERTDVLSFSKATMQHDAQNQLNLLLGDSVNSLLDPELSDEDKFFKPDSESKDINKILSPRNAWHNERLDVLSFSKDTMQHDARNQLNLLLGDSVNSSLDPELSDEDKFFKPDFDEPFQRYNSYLQSGSCLLSPRPSNYLTGIKLKNIAHATGEDLAANYLEYNGNVRYDYLANNERKGSRYDLDKVSIDPRKEESFFSSSKKLSSDVIVCSGFEVNSSDFQEHVLKYPYSSMEKDTDFLEQELKDASSPNSFNNFTDSINTWGEGGITNWFTLRHHTSSIDFDLDSCIRPHSRNLSKTFNPYRRGRSNSAPPFYKGWKKFLALGDSLSRTAGKINLRTVHDCPVLPGTNNLKQIQHHSEMNRVQPSMQPNQYDHSPTFFCEKNLFSDDISDTRIIKIGRGKCSNECHKASFEEVIPKEIKDPLHSGEKWQNSHPHLASGSKSLHLKNQDTILDIASGILHLAGDSLVPSSMDKNCLEVAKVLHQVDKKFIPIVASRILALIDQHAADERILLEELRRKVLSGEMRRTNYLDCEQELVMPEMGFQLLHDYADQIKNWGWICNIHTQGSRSFARNLNIMHKQQPFATLIAVPCILGVNLSDVDLLEFLQQLADTDGSSTIPPSVLRVLNNKACRGAIMFGDALLPSECSLVVEELKQTSLCFQCAHGRPTTAPLVNLDALSEQIAKITSWNKSSREPWHGLHRHEISLERTAQRLSSAMGR